MYRVGKERGGTKIHMVTLDTDVLEDGEVVHKPIAQCSRQPAKVTLESGDPTIYEQVTCERCKQWT